MKTREFIEKHAERLRHAVPLNRERVTCSSVWADNNTIYSYGTHYPLLFTITVPKTNRTLLVCNDRGYSNTTARHISYASQHADVCADIGHGDGTTNRLTYENVLRSVRYKKAFIAEVMRNKKRKDTQVYEQLQREYNRQHTYLLQLMP